MIPILTVLLELELKVVNDFRQYQAHFVVCHTIDSVSMGQV